jgi:hypothetical protein
MSGDNTPRSRPLTGARIYSGIVTDEEGHDTKRNDHAGQLRHDEPGHISRSYAGKRLRQRTRQRHGRVCE